MPIRRAASGSCALARIALPMRVRVMNHVSAMISGTVTPTASRSARRMTTPATVTTVLFSLIRSLTDAGEPPSHSRPTFCRMKEKPTAVISGASLGAFLSGR